MGGCIPIAGHEIFSLVIGSIASTCFYILSLAFSINERVIVGKFKDQKTYEELPSKFKNLINDIFITSIMNISLLASIAFFVILGLIMFCCSGCSVKEGRLRSLILAIIWFIIAALNFGAAVFGLVKAITLKSDFQLLLNEDSKKIIKYEKVCASVNIIFSFMITLVAILVLMLNGYCGSLEQNDRKNNLTEEGNERNENDEPNNNQQL